jgi:hypothetical protein
MTCGKQEASKNDNSKNDLRDTVYQLEAMNLSFKTAPEWERVYGGPDNVISFKKQCADSVFCPALTFIRLADDQILRHDDEAIAALFLSQLKSANYDSIQQQAIYQVQARDLDTVTIRCFEFSFFARGIRLTSSSCVIGSQKYVLLSFLSNDKSPVIHRKSLLEILNGLQRD